MSQPDLFPDLPAATLPPYVPMTRAEVAAEIIRQGGYCTGIVCDDCLLTLAKCDKLGPEEMIRAAKDFAEQGEEG